MTAPAAAQPGTQPGAESPVARGVVAPPAGAKLPPPLLGLLPRGTRREVPPARDWALFALLVFYPVWRLLGFTLFIVPLLAIPMALELFRRGRIRMPAPFVLWILLILFSLASVTMLGETVPGANPPEMGIGRILAYSARLGDMITAGLIMLYIGNLTERELPTKRVAKMMATLFVVTVIGGLVGLFAPRIKFATPLSYVLPHSLTSNSFVKSLVNIEFAQWQVILGDHAEPRPAAPFQYTNTWGQVLVLLLPWFIIATMHGRRTPWGRIWPIGVLLLALIPIVFSLNRGMWMGIGIGIAYVVVRLAMKGSILPIAGVLVGAALVGALILVTPLGNTITERFNTPHSDDGRARLGDAAVEAAMTSPIIGYGGQSETIGSDRSIAIGPSSSCTQCGSRDIGSTGQLWSLLITQGFVGAGLYVCFFLWMGWRFRRDSSWVGMAGGATVLLVMWFMTIYTALTMPLIIMMITMGLLWRNERTKAFT